MSVESDQKPSAFGVHIPFVAHLGFEMIGFEGGQSEMRFTPKPEHKNSFDVAHGGAIMAIFMQSVPRLTGPVIAAPFAPWQEPPKRLLPPPIRPNRPATRRWGVAKR